jgi:hypothetical protein
MSAKVIVGILAALAVGFTGTYLAGGGCPSGGCPISRMLHSMDSPPAAGPACDSCSPAASPTCCEMNARKSTPDCCYPGSPCCEGGDCCLKKDSAAKAPEPKDATASK